MLHGGRSGAADLWSAKLRSWATRLNSSNLVRVGVRDRDRDRAKDRVRVRVRGRVGVRVRVKKQPCPT